MRVKWTRNLDGLPSPLPSPQEMSFSSNSSPIPSAGSDKDLVNNSIRGSSYWTTKYRNMDESQKPMHILHGDSKGAQMSTNAKEGRGQAHGIMHFLHLFNRLATSSLSAKFRRKVDSKHSKWDGHSSKYNKRKMNKKQSPSSSTHQLNELSDAFNDHFPVIYQSNTRRRRRANGLILRNSAIRRSWQQLSGQSLIVSLPGSPSSHRRFSSRSSSPTFNWSEGRGASAKRMDSVSLNSFKSPDHDFVARLRAQQKDFVTALLEARREKGRESSSLVNGYHDENVFEEVTKKRDKVPHRARWRRRYANRSIVKNILENEDDGDDDGIIGKSDPSHEVHELDENEGEDEVDEGGIKSNMEDPLPQLVRVTLKEDVSQIRPPPPPPPPNSLYLVSQSSNRASRPLLSFDGDEPTVGRWPKSGSFSRCSNRMGSSSPPSSVQGILKDRSTASSPNSTTALGSASFIYPKKVTFAEVEGSYVMGKKDVK